MTSTPLPRVAVVGSINLDITGYVDRLPTPGETVAGGTLRRDIGGKGANQAVAAAKLGADVRMIGAIGDDPASWLETTFGPAMDRIAELDPVPL